MKKIFLFLVCVLVNQVMVEGAQREIPVYKKGNRSVKLAVDLSRLRIIGNHSPAEFRRVLENDLKRSGWFILTGRNEAAVAVIGSCAVSGGTLKVRCEVRNAATSVTYLSKTFMEKNDHARKLAHEVADEIVWAVKRVRGIASTRIAMIGSQGTRKDVYLCDADGKNFTRLTKEEVVCIAPNWAPDGAALVYTSFRGGFPDVYRVDLTGTPPKRIAGYPGLNAGADISPDGKRIVLTLSKDGNPDLYIMDRGKRSLIRLTRTRHAAEASPSWSPDGERVVFVSDRSGSPQLYITGLKGNGQTRITFRGYENVSPDWGHDGRIAYSSRRQGRYHICIIDPETGRGEQLTSKAFDHEDPSWAPDNRHIVYTRTVGYHSDLYILDTLGDPSIRLTTVKGNWYSPAWSP